MRLKIKVRAERARVEGCGDNRVKIDLRSRVHARDERERETSPVPQPCGRRNIPLYTEFFFVKSSEIKIKKKNYYLIFNALSYVSCRCRRIDSTKRKSRRGGEGQLALWRARRMQLPGGGTRRPPPRASASTLATINGCSINIKHKHRTAKCSKSGSRGGRGRSVTESERSGSGSRGSSTGSGTGPGNDKVPLNNRKRDSCAWPADRLVFVFVEQHLKRDLETLSSYPRRKRWAKE